MSEWRKRLAWSSEEDIRRTFDATTQLYLNVDMDNRENPREHYQSRFPGLKFPRQKERVATDTFFPSVTSSRGNTCSQLFVGTDSDRWAVYPMKKEWSPGV